MCYRRGQLGLGTLETEQQPQIIEALSGMKIIDIACGAWHSAAVSSFGDVYLWGWNVNGQLSKAVQSRIPIKFDSGRTDYIKHKLPSTFASPEIVNLPKSDHDEENLDEQYNAVHVFCGHRHTVVKTSCNKLLVCGWNKYGALGIKKNGLINVDHFQEVSLPSETIKTIVCGNWCTVVIA